jgi:hypothetical protein
VSSIRVLPDSRQVNAVLGGWRARRHSVNDQSAGRPAVAILRWAGHTFRAGHTVWAARTFRAGRTAAAGRTLRPRMRLAPLMRLTAWAHRTDRLAAPARRRTGRADPSPQSADPRHRLYPFVPLDGATLPLSRLSTRQRKPGVAAPLVEAGSASVAPMVGGQSVRLAAGKQALLSGWDYAFDWPSWVG